MDIDLKDINITEHIHEFRKYLDAYEIENLNRDEMDLERKRLELLKRYNTLVSDRISNAVLVDMLMGHFNSQSIHLRHQLSRLENAYLQKIIDLFILAKKDIDTQ